MIIDIENIISIYTRKGFYKFKASHQGELAKRMSARGSKLHYNEAAIKAYEKKMKENIKKRFNASNAKPNTNQADRNSTQSIDKRIH